MRINQLVWTADSKRLRDALRSDSRSVYYVLLLALVSNYSRLIYFCNRYVWDFLWNAILRVLLFLLRLIRDQFAVPTVQQILR